MKLLLLAFFLITICKSAENDQYHRIKELIEYGKKTSTPRNAFPFIGDYPLHLACANGRFALVKNMVEKQGYNVNEKVQHEIKTKGFLHYITIGTPLMQAIENSHFEVVDYLLTKGAEVDGEVTGNFPLRSACIQPDIRITQLLLEKGAKLDALHRVLIQAIEANNLDALKLLLKYRKPAKKNITLTVFKQDISADMVKELLAQRIHVEVQKKRKNIIVDYASKKYVKD